MCCWNWQTKVGDRTTSSIPLYGGTGGLYTPFEKYIKDNLHLNKSAVSVDQHAKTVTFSDGEVVEYDLLLTTMPLDLLVGRLKDRPETVKMATRGLHHSSGLIVGVGVARPTPSEKCWLYFPEEMCCLSGDLSLELFAVHHAGTEFTFLLLTETSRSEHKPEDKATIIDRVVEGPINTKLLEPTDLDRISSTYLIPCGRQLPCADRGFNGALAAMI